MALRRYEIRWVSVAELEVFLNQEDEPSGLIDAIEGEMNPLGGGRPDPDHIAGAVMNWLRGELLGKKGGGDGHS